MGKRYNRLLHLLTTISACKRGFVTRITRVLLLLCGLLRPVRVNTVWLCCPGRLSNIGVRHATVHPLPLSQNPAPRIISRLEARQCLSRHSPARSAPMSAYWLRQMFAKSSKELDCLLCRRYCNVSPHYRRVRPISPI